MLYFWLKYLHILSSTILFGTGVGTASVMVYGYTTKDVKTIAIISRYVVFADSVFTLPAIIIQPLTGFYMMHLVHYTFSLRWISASFIAYLIALFCWIPVVFIQIKLKKCANNSLIANAPLPPYFYRYFYTWFCLGWPAFFSFLMIFYMMTFKP